MVAAFSSAHAKRRGPVSPPPQAVSVDNLSASSAWNDAYFDGDKFPGGFGTTQLFSADYWTLRKRSAQIFTENLYGRGLIRRFVTNEINTGLTPELCPDEEILGMAEDSLGGWSEIVENRFQIWAKNPELCDYRGLNTFGVLQETIRRESFIEGDILIVLRPSQKTGLPQIQLIRGGRVQTPFSGLHNLPRGNEIKHGVELDKRGRHVAFHVVQNDGSFKRIPAIGPKSGRRLAWLVYGTDKRMDSVRGEPLLSIVLQSLKEIDRYRDSAQRKAVVNSILAMFIEKTDNKPGTLPYSGGARRRETETVPTNDGAKRTFDIASKIPGVVMEELQTGEKPVGFHSQGIDLDFGKFEEAIIQAVAWANEMPPEILRLTFSNNYSASQAAINELKIYLNKIWGTFGDAVCTPILIDWLISEVLLGKIPAPGFLEAWRDPKQYDTFGAWTSTIWYGSIKPSTDMLKQAKGSKMLIDEGWSTNAREARVTTGTKFSKNIKKLKRENQLKAEAAAPLLKLRSEFGEAVTSGALASIEDAVLQLVESGGE